MTSSMPPPPEFAPAVLLLEDNPDYRTLIAEFLNQAGFEVCALPDGRRVAEVLAQHPIALVVTDVGMPECDGLETIMALRRSHPSLPVIAMSGDLPLNTELYLTLASKLGASRVLAKPFPMAQLVDAARELVVGSV